MPRIARHDRDLVINALELTANDCALVITLLPPFYVILRSFLCTNLLFLGVLKRLASNGSRDDAEAYTPGPCRWRHRMVRRIHKAS